MQQITANLRRFPLTAEAVTFILRNNSSCELACGEHCEIAFLDAEGVWRKLPRNEIVNDIGYEVRPFLLSHHA